jgi:hypothetical protein
MQNVPRADSEEELHSALSRNASVARSDSHNGSIVPSGAQTPVTGDPFANPFAATPDRESSVPSAPEVPDAEDVANDAPAQLTPEQQQQAQDALDTASTAVSQAQTTTQHFVSRANEIVQSVIIPAARQAAETAQPVAITIGGKTCKLAVHMAHELLTSPYVPLGIVNGCFQPTQLPISPELPEEWLLRTAKKLLVT